MFDADYFDEIFFDVGEEAPTAVLARGLDGGFEDRLDGGFEE
jgi:hypothetical protein